MNTPFGKPTSYSNDPLDINSDLFRRLVKMPIKPGSLVMYIGHEDIPPPEIMRFIVENELVLYSSFGEDVRSDN